MQVSGLSFDPASNLTAASASSTPTAASVQPPQQASPEDGGAWRESLQYEEGQQEEGTGEAHQLHRVGEDEEDTPSSSAAPRSFSHQQRQAQGEQQQRQQPERLSPAEVPKPRKPAPGGGGGGGSSSSSNTASVGDGGLVIGALSPAASAAPSTLSSPTASSPPRRFRQPPRLSTPHDRPVGAPQHVQPLPMSIHAHHSPSPTSAPRSQASPAARTSDGVAQLSPASTPVNPPRRSPTPTSSRTPTPPRRTVPSQSPPSRLPPSRSSPYAASQHALTASTAARQEASSSVVQGATPPPVLCCHSHIPNASMFCLYCSWRGRADSCLAAPSCYTSAGFGRRYSGGAGGRAGCPAPSRGPHHAAGEAQRSLTTTLHNSNYITLT